MRTVTFRRKQSRQFSLNPHRVSTGFQSEREHRDIASPHSRDDTTKSRLVHYHIAIGAEAGTQANCPDDMHFVITELNFEDTISRQEVFDMAEFRTGKCVEGHPIHLLQRRTNGANPAILTASSSASNSIS